MTIAEAIRKAADRLAAHQAPDARLDAELLLRQVIKRDRAWVFAHGDEQLDSDAGKQYETLLQRRLKREPVHYLIGMREFYGRAFVVTPDVLIPRPETELIIDTALAEGERLPGDPLIIDLCTGSGCIAITLAAELRTTRLLATDLSPEALRVARTNAQRHQVEDRVRLLRGDLFEPVEQLDLAGKADIITANPPYVPAALLGILPPEVRDHEPGMALVAGPEGTEFHRRIIADAPRFLKHGGKLIMEMGIDQADAVRAIVRDTGAYDAPQVLKDLAGIERVLIATKK